MARIVELRVDHLEFPYDAHGWTTDRRDFPLVGPVEIDAEGDLVVPRVPGLGIELDEDVIARTRVGGWCLRLDGRTAAHRRLEP